MGLSFVFILVESLIAVLSKCVLFVFFGQRLVFFRASEINLFSSGGWLHAGFCFYIDSFLYYFVPYIQVPFLII